MDDLKLIKKYYGENMMHLCRELFPTLLETPGLLFGILDKKFDCSKFLYEDIVSNALVENFRKTIYNLSGQKKEEYIREESPIELLKEAGYILYECKTEEEIQSFKKYYHPNEAICTFNEDRLSYCHVFFAVKENVDEIRREDFDDPQRQDKYGTSVISIQFTKGEVNTLSIKNRYNHTVENPDATFSNNLENIILGLTKSFEKHYKLNINQNDRRVLEIPGYVLASDGKLYKYNYEIDNIYYCPDNIIIDHFIAKQYEKEKYIIADYFIIDLVNKKIKLYDDYSADCFVKGFEDIDKIEVVRDKQTGEKNINITPKHGEMIFIKLDKYNRIIKYINNNLTRIGINFLIFNKSLIDLELNNVKFIGSKFLKSNNRIRKIYLPKVVEIANQFMYDNGVLETADFPVLEKVGVFFLIAAQLKKIRAPMLKKADMGFLFYNDSLEEVVFESLEEVGDSCLYYNSCAKIINMNELVKAGSHFCGQSQCDEVYMRKLKEIGHDCFIHKLEFKILKS